MSRWFDTPLRPAPRRLADLPTSGPVPREFQEPIRRLADDVSTRILQFSARGITFHHFLDGGLRDADRSIPGYPAGFRWVGIESLVLLLDWVGLVPSRETGCEELPEPADVQRAALANRERDGVQRLIACGVAGPPPPGPRGPLPPRDVSSDISPCYVPAPTDAEIDARRAAARRWDRVLLVVAPIAALAVWQWGWWGLPPAVLALHAFVVGTWHRDAAGRMETLREHAEEHPELLRC